MSNLESAEGSEVERCHHMLTVRGEDFYQFFWGGGETPRVVIDVDISPRKHVRDKRTVRPGSCQTKLRFTGNIVVLQRFVVLSQQKSEIFSEILKSCSDIRLAFIVLRGLDPHNVVVGWSEIDTHTHKEWITCIPLRPVECCSRGSCDERCPRPERKA